jgi:hypothetical protein
MWVYWTLLPKERMTVHVPLLCELGRIAGYKAGWAYYKAKEIRKNKKEEAKETI